MFSKTYLILKKSLLSSNHSLSFSRTITYNHQNTSKS